MELNETQVRILTKFITAGALKYSEGRPDGVDNDLYKYHLKFLLQKRYLKKVGNLYELTERGKGYGHSISPEGEVQKKFYVCVMIVLIRENKGKREVLVQRRNKHPNFGELGTVNGKVKPSEGVVEAAKRRLREETGLIATFKYVGMLRAIRHDRGENLLMDQWFNVCLATACEGELIEDSPGYGHNYFVDLQSLMRSIDQSNSVRNLIEIIGRIDSDEIPFLIEDRAVVQAE